LDRTSTVYVLSSLQEGVDEKSLQALVQFLGVDAQLLSEPPENDPAPGVAKHFAATCESLTAFQRHPLGLAWLLKSLSIKGSTFFLTGVNLSKDCSAALSTILPNVVDSVRPVSTKQATYTISSDPRSGMGPLAALTFGPVEEDVDAAFSIRSGTVGLAELISIDGRPCYVTVERAGATYFLLACARVLDISAPARNAQLLDCFLRFVPFISYLRTTFGALCWYNDSQAACFIVDDPLLRRRYGFLELDRLESHMAQSRFSMNIAFIPWNRRRSDPRVTERFKRGDRRFSISVHGCDHTEGEFGATDEETLRVLSHRARSHMKEHEDLTGISHNRVMIFPQGTFSKASLRVLGDEGFLAAVNSTLFPVDGDSDEITFRDLMDVAVLRFGGVPLFLRHYPRRLEQFALDAFLGRQVLIVEHHGFFKHGYDEAERYTAFVNRVAPDITWTDLEELCASASLKRDTNGCETYVRAFGPVLHLRNRHPRRTNFRVSNPWAQGRYESVTWTGRAISVDVQHSTAECCVVLDPNEEATIHFQGAVAGPHAKRVRPQPRSRFKTFVRRTLCEFRDNYLDRSPVLSDLARRAKLLLPRL
jgi:hypothetical protein